MAGITLDVNIDEKGMPKVKRLEGAVEHLARRTETSGAKWNRTWAGMGRSVETVGLRLARLARWPALIAGSAAAGGFGMLIKQGVRFNAELEETQTQFGVIYQDTRRAAVAMKELVDFAARTPFQFPELAQAAKSLESFGIGGVESLRRAGDAAAFAKRPLEEITSMLGRIKGGGFGEAFNRLAELGIATRPMLEGEGLQFDRGGSYIGSVDDAMGAVERIIDRRFGGMMEKVSQTWNGKWSTMVDAFQMMTGDLARPIFERLKPRLDQVAKLFEKIGASPVARAVFRNIAKVLDGIVEKMLAWAENFENIIRAVVGVGLGFKALWDGIGAGVEWVKGVIDGLADYVGVAFGRLQIKAAIAWNKILRKPESGTLKMAEQFIDGIYESMSARLAAAFDAPGMGQAIADGLSNAMNVARGKAPLPFNLGELFVIEGPGGMGLQGPPAPEPGPWEEAYAQIAAIEERFRLESAEMWASYWKDMQVTAEHGFSDVIADTIIDSGSTLAQNFNRIWREMKATAIRMTTDIAVHWIAMEIKKAVLSAKARAAAAAAERTAAAAEQSAAAGAATAKYHMAYAGIPFIGPGIASGFIGSMMAQIATVKAAALAMRTGGKVPGGGSGMEDDQRVNLSGGEYIQPRSSVQKYGERFMDQVRTGTYAPQGGGEIHLHFGESGNSDFERDVEVQLVPVVEKLYRQGRLKFATGRP